MITYLIGDALFFFLLFLSTKFDPFPLVNRPVNESGGDGEDNGQAFVVIFGWFGQLNSAYHMIKTRGHIFFSSEQGNLITRDLTFSVLFAPSVYIFFAPLFYRIKVFFWRLPRYVILPLKC